MPIEENVENNEVIEDQIVEIPPEEISMYDFNKANMAQIKPLDIESLKKLCIDAMKEIAIGSFWMLLNRETYDYTVFVNEDTFTEERKGEILLTTLLNRGSVVDFTKQPNGAYEIWIRVPVVNNATGEKAEADIVYYFFNYDMGIVEV